MTPMFIHLLHFLHEQFPHEELFPERDFDRLGRQPSVIAEHILAEPGIQRIPGS